MIHNPINGERDPRLGRWISRARLFRQAVWTTPGPATTLPGMSSPPPDPVRPLMEPARGVRQVKLRPHEMTEALTATENVFVLAHLGVLASIPRSGRSSLTGWWVALAHSTSTR